MIQSINQQNKQSSNEMKPLVKNKQLTTGRVIS